MNAKRGANATEMQERIDALEAKVESLERLRRDLIVGMSVFAVLALAFFGFQWRQIGKHVDDSLKDSGLAKAQRKVEQLGASAQKDVDRIAKVADEAVAFKLPEKVSFLATEVSSIGRIQVRTGDPISVTEGRAGWDIVKRCPDGQYVAGVGGRGGGGGDKCYNCVDIVKFVCEPFRVPIEDR